MLRSRENGCSDISSSSTRPRISPRSFSESFSFRIPQSAFRILIASCRAPWTCIRSNLDPGIVALGEDLADDRGPLPDFIGRDDQMRTEADAPLSAGHHEQFFPQKGPEKPVPRQGVGGV